MNALTCPGGAERRRRGRASGGSHALLAVAGGRPKLGDLVIDLVAMPRLAPHQIPYRPKQGRFHIEFRENTATFFWGFLAFLLYFNGFYILLW